MTLPQTLRARLPELLGIDLRSLALLRVLLATVLLADFARRLFCDFTAFHADAGVLPADALLATDGAWRINLLLLNPGSWFAALALAAGFLAAAALWLGYRTRLALFALFLVELAVQNRNPLVLNAGDSLIMCLLFWSLFLPVAARWSVDAALSLRKPPEADLHFSWASAGLVIQVLAVYFFGALANSAWAGWPGSAAGQYAAQFEALAAPAGTFLLARPDLLSSLAHAVYFLDLLGPLIALFPWGTRALRFIVLCAFLATHAAFAVLLDLGLIPYASLAALPVLLGGWWWEWAAQRTTSGRSLRIFYDRDCGFCLKSCLLYRELLVLQNTSIQPAQDNKRADALMQAQYSWVVIDGHDVAHTKWNAFVALLRHSSLLKWIGPLAGLRIWEKPGTMVYDWVARNRGAFGTVTGIVFPRRDETFETGAWLQKIAAAFVVLMLVSNLGSLGALPSVARDAIRPVLSLARIDQDWRTVVPRSALTSGWAVFPGELENGSVVDVLRPGRPLSWDKPHAPVTGDIRWHVFRWHLRTQQHAQVRAPYAEYLCRDWNADAPPGQRLARFSMAWIVERADLPGRPETEREVGWRQECLSSGAAVVD